MRRALSAGTDGPLAEGSNQLRIGDLLGQHRTGDAKSDGVQDALYTLEVRQQIMPQVASGRGWLIDVQIRHGSGR